MTEQQEQYERFRFVPLAADGLEKAQKTANSLDRAGYQLAQVVLHTNASFLLFVLPEQAPTISHEQIQELLSRGGYDPDDRDAPDNISPLLRP